MDEFSVRKDEHSFGEQPPGSLKIAFGDFDDPDEMCGGYWFSETECPAEGCGQEEGQSWFQLVGSHIRNGTEDQVQAVALVVEARPVLPISQLQGIDVDFAFEVTRDIVENSKLLEEQQMLERRLLDEAKAMDDPQSEGHLFVRVGDRLVDVHASLKHVYDDHCDFKSRVPKEKLGLMLQALDLFLDEEEYREALLAFPDQYISFDQFRTWWIS